MISQRLGSEIDVAIKTYQALSAAHRLDAAPVQGVSTLRQMLAASLPNAAQQLQFSALYAQYGDDPATFWHQVETAFDAAIAVQLQLDGQLHFLVCDNVALLTALKATQGATPISSTLDLATRGYYDPIKWTTLISQPVPPGIPGGAIDAQRANYAALLAAQVRIAHPTAVVADQVTARHAEAVRP